jgi:hypothetical protein
MLQCYLEVRNSGQLQVPNPRVQGPHSNSSCPMNYLIAQVLYIDNHITVRQQMCNARELFCCYNEIEPQ